MGFMLQAHMGWSPCWGGGGRRVANFAGVLYVGGIVPALALKVIDGEEGEG